MSQLNVQFLGSGDFFGSGGRFQTCIYVQSNSTHFLIDCGASSLIAMKRFGVESNQIDFILLSHLHGDHFGGLPFFILEAQLVSGRTNPLIVAGPSGSEARICQSMELLFPGASQIKRHFPLKFVTLKNHISTSIKTVAVTPYQVNHPSGAPAFALRVDSGSKIIAYSGDTEWTDTLLDAASGADLFICEAYFYDKKVKYHLDYLTLLEHRPALDCRRLILTHMNDDLLSRLDDLEIEWAQDGKRIIL